MDENTIHISQHNNSKWQTLLKKPFMLIITCCALCLWDNQARAQQINLNVKQEKLINVLKQVRKQSNYAFVFNPTLQQKAQPVTANFKGISLTTALNNIFKEQAYLQYELLDKTIYIKAKIPDKKTTSFTLGNISGVVYDVNSKPLTGATVKVKRTNVSTTTNAKGEFILSNANENAILEISYIGYETKEVTVQNAFSITLSPVNSELNEVQIIGYGTTTKRLNTGSVATVKAEDIERQPVSNPLAALQGRVPGLEIVQTSGVPGSSFTVQIRGRNSIDLALSQNNPLFIIDGVPFEAASTVTNQNRSAANNPTNISSGGLSPLNAINPGDIESIDILKDADATSIYGSRGANGVILITTKKGKQGKTSFNIGMDAGVSRIGRTMDMLNTEQYISMRQEAFKNDGLVPSATPGAGFAPDLMLWDTNRYTDFKDLLIGGTAQYQNVRASVSGGTALTQFRLGGNFHRETTVYPGDFSNRIGSFNMNLNHSNAKQTFTVQFSGIYSNSNNNLPSTDLTRFINLPPNLKLYNADGSLAWDDAGIVYNTISEITNPLSVLYQTITSKNENLSGNLNLKLKIIDGLFAKANIGYGSFNTNEQSTFPTASIDVTRSILPSAGFGSSNNQSWIVEPQLEYNHGFDWGKINILAGNTLQHKSDIRSYMNGTNYTSDLLLGSIDAAGTITASNYKSVYRYAAFFGRISYNYQDKYLANLSARRDGSSRFGPDRQWATFGSIGLGWIFSAEHFIKESLPFLSYGKLRGSYGTTGNDQIGDYKYLNLWRNTTSNYSGVPGLAPKSLFNPEYNWEVNKKFELALELGFFKDRILFTSAFYRNRSSNQLINYALPAMTGFGTIIRNFPGLVENMGFELTLNTRNFETDNFKWSSGLNISIPRNKLLSFPGLETSSYKNSYVIGQSLSIIRSLNYLGLDPSTGLYTFEDRNKDGVIFDGDYIYSGNLDPKFTGGLQNNLSMGRFDLSFFFQFTKRTGINYLRKLSSRPPGTLMNQPDIVLNRWQNPGDNTEIQRFTAITSGPAYVASSNISLSSGAYTDASFVKLRNVSLGYNLSKTLLSKLHMGACRVYMDMQNVLTITGYKGSDPEVQDFYVLPSMRTIVAGVQINF